MLALLSFCSGWAVPGSLPFPVARPTQACSQRVMEEESPSTADSSMTPEPSTTRENSNDAGASDSGNDGGRATTDGGSCTPEADRVCSCALGRASLVGAVAAPAKRVCDRTRRNPAARLPVGLRAASACAGLSPNGSPVAPDVAVAGVQVDNVTWVGDQFAVFTGTEWTRVSTAGEAIREPCLSPRPHRCCGCPA